MNTVFIPNYSKDNPYQNLLAESLIKFGINIRMVNTFYLQDIFKKNEKVDILHVHWSGFILETVGGGRAINIFLKSVAKMIFIRLKNIKIVWTIHNLEEHERENAGYKKYYNYLLFMLSSRIIVHSDSAFKIVSNYYNLFNKNKIKVIPHGHYINSYENSISKEEARKILNIEKTKTVFIFMGHLRKYKGIINLILSFRKIKNDQAVLLIAGKPFDNDIKKEIIGACSGDGRIKLVFEFIEADKIQIYMNSADVVICPLENILTSGSVILAMSFGKPIIAPDIGCIRDAVDETGSILYDVSDNNGLLNAMGKVLTISNLYEMGEKNFIKVMGYSWNSIGGKTYELYKESLNGKDKNSVFP